LGLALALLAAYGVQTWLERALGPDAAHAAAAFLLNFSQVPESDAPWRYLSTAFVHASLGSSFGLLHVGFNVWVLFDLGRLYEARRHWGSLLAAFVFGTAAGAYLTSVMQAGDQLVLVGASGGVLGVAGALLADTLNSKNPYDRSLTRSLLQWVAIIMVLSVAIPQVSLWGHAGGLLGGLLWGFLRQGLGPANAALPDRVAGAASLLAIGWALAMVAGWLLRYT
ncbi:MAG: rhomboid family intramembrane serine protease, partial [Deinococcota bacterium]|nr:rhomboid family intramembrane serine protease [Deinococcota bacterium]